MPTDKNLAKMKRLFAAMDEDSLTREEFKDAFKKVVEYVKKIDQRNVSDVKAMTEALNKLANKIDSRASSNMEMTKKEAIAFMKGEVELSKSDLKKLASMIDAKMAQVQNGLDGKDADQESMIEEVLERVLEPALEGVGKNIPALGTAVRDSLELLQGDERLDVKAIKGLEELLKESKGKKDSSAIVGGGGVSRNAVRYYDLSGSLNGVLKTFTLPVFARILDVKLSSVPVMRQTTDYTIDVANSQITFTSEITADQDLSSGQSCIILYSE